MSTNDRIEDTLATIAEQVLTNCRRETHVSDVAVEVKRRPRESGIRHDTNTISSAICAALSARRQP